MRILPFFCGVQLLLVVHRIEANWGLFLTDACQLHSVASPHQPLLSQDCAERTQRGRTGSYNTECKQIGPGASGKKDDISYQHQLFRFGGNFKQVRRFMNQQQGCGRTWKVYDWQSKRFLRAAMSLNTTLF